jgi:DNA-directed RNA polymerase specialized sigma24 family protein
LKRNHLDQKEVRNINDIDLSDPLHLRRMIEEWHTVEILSENHIKVKDLFMELEARWINSPISDLQRSAIRLYLMEGYTQREAGERLGVGTRIIANAMNEGLEIMANYGGYNDRQLAG